MAAVPKCRRSHREVRLRRTHWHAHMPPAVECPHCHELKLPHRVCPHCGYYNGMEIVAVEEKKKG
ncbi:50S ribosomal protein L32 [Candidatus Bipolaricaulota bacterium]|nr:50S ribosomal protein L32 [Candidatus Bipolaricaulota bacterium]